MPWTALDDHPAALQRTVLSDNAAPDPDWIDMMMAIPCAGVEVSTIAPPRLAPALKGFVEEAIP